MNWITIDKGTSKRAYFVKELLEGKEETSYYRIGKIFRATEDGAQSIILVQNKDNKFGAIDKNGKLVIPIEYDEIDDRTIQKKKYLIVKKDGKLGIMKRP